jgi:ferric-dicitrate binding protein FerR (iron transport regulator)
VKLKGRVPVEQLDDERLTNIERKLVVAVSDMRAEPDRSWSRRGLAVAGFAMAVAVAGVVGWKLHAPTHGPAAPTVAEAPYTLSTTNGTKVQITHVGSRTELAMGKGTLSLDVKHDPNRLLVVHAGDTDIEDVGTKFSVDYDGSGHVEVRVTEGEVKVKRAGKDFEVTANNAWTTEQGTITLAQLDNATTVVAQNEPDIQIDTPTGETPKTGSATTATGSNATGSAAANAGSNAMGSASGSGAGSGSGKHKAGETNIRKAILAVKLDPLPGSIPDYVEQLKTTSGDKSRILYSIAVKLHEAKNDEDAISRIRGIISQRTKDEAYADAMWLQVRITCLRALDDHCRAAAQRYVNSTDSGAIPSNANAGIADKILKAIENGE